MNVMKIDPSKIHVKCTKISINKFIDLENCVYNISRNDQFQIESYLPKIYVRNSATRIANINKNAFKSNANYPFISRSHRWMDIRTDRHD